LLDDFSLEINENTLQKMKNVKEEMGFGTKSWSDWFESLFGNSKKQSEKEIIEKVFRDGILKVFYEDWVRYFALNLENIWYGHSARKLIPKKKGKTHSAIVIGRGPSLQRHNHLKLLASSNYKGTIICTDGALPEVLKAGVIPTKFKKFYVVTIDTLVRQKDFYNDPVCKKYGNYIKCVLPTIVPPVVYFAAKNAGMKIYWIHTLFDYKRDDVSFNQIENIMVKAKNHKKGLPAIQTGANVGTASWIIAWSILKCSTVALIGIDHGYDIQTPWSKIKQIDPDTGKIITFPKDIDQNSNVFKKAYPTIYNPDFDCYVKQNPTFVYYSNALKEFIFRTMKRVKTINATEGGAIFGEGIESITLKNFLEKYNF